jgi:hypothetical protein
MNDNSSLEMPGIFWLFKGKKTVIKSLPVNDLLLSE